MTASWEPPVKHDPSFLRLFRIEFDELCTENPDFGEKIVELSDKNLRKEAHEIIAEPRDPPLSLVELRQIYFGCLAHSKNNEVYNYFHKCLIDSYGNHPELELCLTTKPELDQGEDNFSKFFDPAKPFKLDTIVACLDPITFVKQSERLGIEIYNDIMKDVNRHLSVMRESIRESRRDSTKGFQWGITQMVSSKIILNFMYAVPGTVNNRERSWYWDFVYICYQCGVENQTILPWLEPNILSKMDNYIAKLSVVKDEFSIHNKDEMVEEEGELTEFRPQSHFRRELPEFDDEGAVEIQLRSYQKELVKDARSGKNTVICAPTGSGKTIVAVDIIKNHLDSLRFDNFGLEQEKTRCVFIVPTVPLVDQQLKVCQTYLKHQYKCQGFYGGDKYSSATERMEMILKSDVVVITPQLLLNMMNSILKKERLYPMIMEILHKKRDTIPVQVVGLTASLGIGSGNDVLNVDRAMDHIMRMCVRMMATTLSTVRKEENILELKKHVSPPLDDVRTCARPKDDPYSAASMKVLKQIVEILKPDFEEAQFKGMEKIKNFSFKHLQDRQWDTKIDQLKEMFTHFDDTHIVMRVNLAITHMKLYCFGMKLNDLLPAYYAMTFLKTEMEKMRERELHQDIVQLNRDLMKLYESVQPDIDRVAHTDNGSTKQILTQLIEILAEAYTSNPATQTLIFVERRRTAQILVDFLLNSRKLKSVLNSSDQFARYLTSSNQSSKFGGMSSAEQKLIIKNFRDGRIKLLVVTSVAEEGLDIDACNLVIKYNSVGSERTMIQRRGRARALGSKTVLLALDGSVESREMDNITKEDLLNKCLLNIQGKGDAHLKRDIEVKAAEVQMEKLTLEEEQEATRRSLSHSKYNLLCENCTTLFCTSKDIRCVLGCNYVCVNPEIWGKMVVHEDDKPSKDEYVIKCGQVKCMNCNEKLGEVIKFAQVYYPSLTSTKIIFQEDHKVSAYRSQDRMKEAWSKVAGKLFIVENLSVEDQIKMINALSTHIDTYKMLQGSELIAIQRQKEAMKRRRERKERREHMYDDVDTMQRY